MFCFRQRLYWLIGGGLAAIACCAIPLVGSAVVTGGETLYNGIELPDQWPPDVRTLTLDPMPVPYLEHPPEVIPIDVGRQLFVDDFLIDSTTSTRTFHKATWHPASPVMVPDRTWESPAEGERGAAGAMPFSDGVWFDPADGLYKMWYLPPGENTRATRSHRMASTGKSPSWMWCREPTS